MIFSERTRAGGEPADIRVRVAVYPESGEPEITEIAAGNPRSATQKFSRFIMDKVQEYDGPVPEAAVREVVENLVHAGYQGVVISVLDEGRKVRISDKGPGVSDKSRAMEFGFSGARPGASQEIRGIGAGLGIAQAALAELGGHISLEDNIGGGTVTTIFVPQERSGKFSTSVAAAATVPRYPDGVPRMNISERQQKALITVLECGEVGPSTVADRLEISVSTAYRDLSVLEEHGLVLADETGKRLISPLGRDLVDSIIGSWVK
ncbi:hypothetical protein BH23ACT11_BH23ACT11_06740 [soil metagenome]